MSGATPFSFPLVDVEGGAPDACTGAVLLAERGHALGVKDLQEALRDHFGLPDSVCRHRAPRPDGTEIEIVASVVMNLAEGELRLCPGHVCENDYQRLTLRAR